jgi:hypothetical protein
MAFKSEIHVAELASIRTGHTEGDIYYILDNGMLGDLPCKPGTFVEWHNNDWRILADERYTLKSEMDAASVKYMDRYTSYSNVAAAISRGQLPIMTIVSGGTVYYYFPFYNGSGRIEFRSIQDNGIDCFTWNGTAWVAGDSVIYGMGSDTKSEADIDQGVLAIDGGNVVTKVTLATVNAVTFSVNERVPAFAIEIDNTGNSNDVDITVVNGATTLKYSSAAGNQVGAGKYVQLTCVGGCWTLAEFEAPTP